MAEITLTTTIDESHRLILDVPHDIPVGRVEVVIRAAAPSETPIDQPLTLESAKAKLRAAGLLYEPKLESDEFEELSEEELDELGLLFAGDRPSHELIDEDRGPR